MIWSYIDVIPLFIDDPRQSIDISEGLYPNLAVHLN